MEGRATVVLPLRPFSMIALPFDRELGEYWRMRLTQKELDRLTVFTLAELVRRRRARGRRLNLPEAMAIICDEIFEQAWDGRPLAEVIEAARSVLTDGRAARLEPATRVALGLRLDGRAARLEPATRVALGQLYHIA